MFKNKNNTILKTTQFTDCTAKEVDWTYICRYSYSPNSVNCLQSMNRSCFTNRNTIRQWIHISCKIYCCKYYFQQPKLSNIVCSNRLILLVSSFNICIIQQLPSTNLMCLNKFGKYSLKQTRTNIDCIATLRYYSVETDICFFFLHKIQ